MEFEVIKTVGKARLGKLRTPHGEVETPVFMPVGTNANVKLLTPRDLEEIGVEIVLANTFHLMLKPGVEIVKLHGGLHGFMRWNRPILTDSGGFQVFSLPKIRIDDEGVVFKSPLDGSSVFMTPELSMEVQMVLGSDICMAFDHCPPVNASHEETREATERTYKWALRSKKAFHGEGQALFGIVQGGLFPDLRKKSATEIVSIGFDGYAIGGLSLGEEREITYDMTELVVEHLPEDKPRYFMGGGSPDLILELVERGVDMFDSVFPTRLARHGTALTWNGRLNVKASYNKKSLEPIDERCECYACKTFTRSYIHHLFNRGEFLGQVLLTIHNVSFMVSFMKELRKAILNDKFQEFKSRMLEFYSDQTTQIFSTEEG